MRAVPESPLEAPAPGPAGHGAPRENPVMMAHRILAGRYHWAILLGLVMGAAMAALAHFYIKNQYLSTGEIHIPAVTQSVLGDRTTIMPMFNSYMDAQVSLILSQRIVDTAMDSDDWQAATKKSRRTLGQFIDSLRVTHDQDSELIEISFTDYDPQIAAAAVKAVITAYTKVAGDDPGELKRGLALEARRQELVNHISDDEKNIQEIAGAYAGQDLNAVRDEKRGLCNTLQTSLNDKELLLAIAPPDEVATSQPGDGAAPKLTPEAIAARGDQPMIGLLQQRDTLNNQLTLLTTQGLGDMHASVKTVQAQLRAVQDAIAQRVASYQPAGAPAGGNFSPGTQWSRSQLQRLVDTLQAQLAAAQKELEDVAKKATQVNTIKTDEARDRDELDSINQQLKERGLQRQVAGKFDVQSDGDVPFRPIRDKNKAMTRTGAAGGFALGFALVGLLGFFDRRLKSVHDAQRFLDHSNRVLGILPALPEDLKNPEQANIAAYCVHHIRTLLQLGEGTPGRPVIAVTSAGPGDGKTSLVLSLGHSYAATGARTLLIDFDFVGEGLTARSGAVRRRRLGDILVRQGSLSREALDAALLAKSSGLLGEKLVQMGLIAHDELEQALAAQRATTVGLLDVLEGESFAACVADAGGALHVLAVGDQATRRHRQLSLPEVQRILGEAQKEYDVILVDTGPVLGSLEACMVAAAADEVIVVMARGQQGPLVDKAMQRLREIGAKIAGVVFNRADQKDMQHSIYSSYRQSIRADGATRRPQMLGPVARAVVDSDLSIDSLPGDSK